MAFEWVAGLFQSEEARGLSGESASSVALDDANPYYNYRLRRHATEGDVVADVGLLWYTSPYVAQRQGLGTHVAAEVGEGVANYTDVLLILSQDDFERARQATGEAWTSVVSRQLHQEFENFCRREGLRRPHAHRPLGFKVLADGSEQMHGRRLGLGRGEFITGLLPNLYTGPVFGSYPVIGVHVNLPGVWEGYKEVGRLHNDQILFTLGNHWLDNYSHPTLAEAALYRLQQYPDGNFVHIINPDLQDRYQVTSTVQNNASVLTLATRDGQPLAYMVLAVMEPPAAAPSAAPAAEREHRDSAPRINLPTPTPRADQRKPSGFEDPIPSVAPPMLIDDEVQPVPSTPASSSGLGGKTIIPDAPSERIFTLQERGALLQKVHFSAFMLGYDVYMGARGELGTKVENPAATFEVRKRSTSLVAHADGVRVGTQSLRRGESVELDGDTEIVCGDTRLEYRDLRTQAEMAGWPYVAEIRRPASSTYLIWGEEYRIGRSRECRVVLPDQTSNDNIHWKPKIGDGAYIRARTGDIPKANFYTDSIMVSSEHGTIDLTGQTPRVACNASHCYVFVRRRGELLTLSPTSKEGEDHAVEVEPGDEVLIGNCLFQVGFSPAGVGIAPGPAPEVSFSADSLAAAAPEPDFSVDEPADAPPTPLASMDELPDDEASDEDPTLRFIGKPGDVEQEPASDPDAAPIPDLDDEAAWGDAEETSPAVQARHPLMMDDEDEAATAMMSHSAQLDDEDAPPAVGLGERGAEPAPVRVSPVGTDSIMGDARDFGFADDDDGVRDEDEPAPPAPSRAPDLMRASTFNSELGDPEDDEDWNDNGGLPLVDASADVGGWDEEDGSVDVTQPPPTPVATEDDSADDPPSIVPKPFPELDEEEPAATDAPLAAATPEPAPEPPAPAVAAPVPVVAATRDRVVVFTDDSEAQFELGRPCHVILAGWMVNGEVVVGNHAAADLVVPENRIVETQTFQACDYLRLKVRGRKGTMDVLAPTEVLIDEADPTEDTYESVEAHTIDIIRRDDAGEEDFAIRLVVREDRALPDPRARLVALDYEDPLAAALVTRGLPLSQPRPLSLGDMRLTLTWDGAHVTVSDYLASYRGADGTFRPFFIQQGDKRFTTAPEDGSAFQLAGGDRLVVGQAVYVVREE